MKQKFPPLSEQRTRDIIDAYGARPAHWPAAERQAALDCLARSQSLQDYCRQHEALDTRIQAVMQAESAEVPGMQALQQRILHELPKQQRTRFALFEWLNMPRLALGSIGLLAIALLLMLHRSHVPPPMQADSAYEVWAWYDITGQELPEDNTSTTMSMTDFIELDEPPGNS